MPNEPHKHKPEDHNETHKDAIVAEAAKATALALATVELTSRVASLTGVVQTNNDEIKRLRKEVDSKPDDAEVQFITGMARTERVRQLKYAIATALLTSLIAGLIAFKVADLQGAYRCAVNAQNIDTIVGILEDVKSPKLQPAIDDLNSNRNEC